MASERMEGLVESLVDWQGRYEVSLRGTQEEQECGQGATMARDALLSAITDLESTITTLRAEVEGLRELAEVGELVERMGECIQLSTPFTPDDLWEVRDWRSRYFGRVIGSGPTALLALRAALGEPTETTPATDEVHCVLYRKAPLPAGEQPYCNGDGHYECKSCTWFERHPEDTPDEWPLGEPTGEGAEG